MWKSTPSIAIGHCWPQPASSTLRRPSPEISAIASYVASLGQGPAVPEQGKYSTAGLSEEEIARGGELFRTNCSACHNIEGRGGALPVVFGGIHRTEDGACRHALHLTGIRCRRDAIDRDLSLYLGIGQIGL